MGWGDAFANAYNAATSAAKAAFQKVVNAYDAGKAAVQGWVKEEVAKVQQVGQKLEHAATGPAKTSHHVKRRHAKAKQSFGKKKAGGPVGICPFTQAVKSQATNSAKPTVKNENIVNINDKDSWVLSVKDKYLGKAVHDLKQDPSDNLEMDKDTDDDVSCANFVSSVLIEYGLIDKKIRSDSVQTLKQNLKKDGWVEVSYADAKPGDVVVMKNEHISHVEIYFGDGKMIGANNTGVNYDGPQVVSINKLKNPLPDGYTILHKNN